MKKISSAHELPIDLMENNPIRFVSEQPEDYLSFREYYMIEGHWIPLINDHQAKELNKI